MPGKVIASEEGDVHADSAHEGHVACGAVRDDFEARYIFDTGASRHTLNSKHVNEEERRNIRPLQKPYFVDTCNGPVWIDSYIEIQL